VPGDHVDVLVTLNHQTAGKDLTEIILQNIDVLAVAQSYVNEQSSQTLAPAAINNVVSAIPGTSAGASPPRPSRPHQWQILPSFILTRKRLPWR